MGADICSVRDFATKGSGFSLLSCAFGCSTLMHNGLRKTRKWIKLNRFVQAAIILGGVRYYKALANFRGIFGVKVELHFPSIWAHAGTFPYPDLIADYLRRYPALHIDVSVRDDRIARNGEISDDWYELFLTYPDRVMIGVDTYSLSRWHNFDSAVERIRRWLALLPDEIASRLAYDNAAAFFNNSPQRQGD